MRLLIALGFVAALVALSGCATVTGALTGSITGPRDLTSETCRQNSVAYDDNPMLYGLGAIVLTPVGIVLGPICGMVKGVSLDVEAMQGMVSYRDIFCTGDEMSVWRPFTFDWPARPGEK